MRPTIPRRIYNYFLNHWILSAIVLTISGHWFVIMRIAGKNLHLIDSQEKMTILAHLITWPLFLLSLAFALLKTAADKYNEQAKNKGGFILQRMLDSVNAVTSKKMRRFCEFIKLNKGKKDLKPFGDITQPKRQIESILDNIQVTLSEIFGINRDEIGLSILYKSDTSDDWDWLFAVNTTNDLDQKILISNPHTAARQIIDGKTTSLFYPDKRVGIQKREYVSGPKDESFDNVGSVLCREISIGNSKKCLSAILSITTYGKQLCDQDDTDAKHKIENIIIPTFESRIQLELALLYIKEVLSPKCLACPA